MKIWTIVLIGLFWAGICFAEVGYTNWKYSLQQVNKVGDKVHFIINIINPEGVKVGREISWEYSEVKDLTLAQLQAKLKTQAQYIIGEDYEEYLLKKKVSLTINTELGAK